MFYVGIYDSDPFEDFVNDNIEPILRAEIIKVLEECSEENIQFNLTSVPLLAKNNNANISYLTQKILDELKPEYPNKVINSEVRSYNVKPLEFIRDCDLILAYYYEGITPTAAAAKKIIANITKKKPEANIEQLFNPVVQLAIHDVIETELTEEERTFVEKRIQGDSLKMISRDTEIAYSRVNRLEFDAKKKIIASLQERKILG